MCRPEAALALQADALETESLAIELKDVKYIDGEPLPTRRERACRVLCCGATSRGPRSLPCGLRWCARALVWLVVLAAAAGLLLWEFHPTEDATGGGSVTSVSRLAAASNATAAMMPLMNLTANETRAPTMAPSACARRPSGIETQRDENRSRGDAVSATWRFRDDESRRCRGRNVDIPWRRVAATPRPRRGYSVATDGSATPWPRR